MFDAEIHLHDVIDRSGVKVDLDEYLKVHAVVIQLMDEDLLAPTSKLKDEYLKVQEVIAQLEERVETCWICDNELVQQGGSVGESSWLCNNPKCMKAYQGIVTPF